MTVNFLIKLALSPSGPNRSSLQLKGIGFKMFQKNVTTTKTNKTIKDGWSCQTDDFVFIQACVVCFEAS